MRLFQNQFSKGTCLKLFLVALSFLLVVLMSVSFETDSTPGTVDNNSVRNFNVTAKPENNFLPIDASPKNESVQSNNSSAGNATHTVSVGSKIMSSKAADALPRNGSVFVWVLTSPKYFETRVPAVNETWLKRCGHGQFFTTEPMDDPSIPFTTVFSDMDDSYGQLFHKTMKAFDYAYNNISDKFDWYMKADDDTYVIMEHLKDFLSQFDPKQPYFFGHPFKPFLENGYNSGGAGYILSNEAVRILVNEVSKNETVCPFHEFEDVGIARCLASKDIFPFDTRNQNEQHRFKPFSIESSFIISNDTFYPKWPQKFKYDAFAPEQITFHHLKPAEIRMIEMLLYVINDPHFSKHFKS